MEIDKKNSIASDIVHWS